MLAKRCVPIAECLNHDRLVTQALLEDGLESVVRSHEGAYLCDEAWLMDVVRACQKWPCPNSRTSAHPLDYEGQKWQPWR